MCLDAREGGLVFDSVEVAVEDRRELRLVGRRSVE